MINRIALYIFLFLSVFANAQVSEPAMADGMRADGKIYVVITVIAVVFVCVAAYLIIIDRKVKKLEDKLKK
jgi:hypothetical protein